MSAPKSRDPLAVTTRDGMSWVRRAVTQDGRGLYAPEGVCSCPEFVMATLAELAEHGIKGRDPLADAVAVMGALPVPVGPNEPAVDKTHGLIAAAIGEAKPARDGVLVSLAQSVKDRAEHDHSTTADWDWYCLNLSGYMGDRMGPVLRRLLDAESERDALRVRVAELDRVIDGLRALLPTEPREERGLPNDLAHETGWYGAWQQVAEVLGESLPYARPVDEDPIACSLTVEALHASSGAVIETPSRREQSSAKLRGLLARQQAAVEAAHETPPRPRPTPHDLPEVTP